MADENNLDLDAMADEVLSSAGEAPDDAVDMDLDAMADEVLAEYSGRGVVGQALDWTKEKAQDVYDWAYPKVKSAAETGEDIVRSIPSGPQVARGFSTALDVSDRLAGTAIGAGAEMISNSPVIMQAVKVGDAIANKLGYDRSIEEGLKVVTDAKTRMEAEGVDTSDITKWRNWLPVSLVGDILFPYGKEAMAGPGRLLQKAENQTVKETGEALEGLSSAGGIATSVVGGSLLDPLAMIRFGQLTKLGQAAEKAGKLTPGVAKSMAAGERSLIELGFGGGLVPRATFGSTTLGKVGPKVVDKVAEALTTSEIFELPLTGGKTLTFNDFRNFARKFTTESPLWRFNQSLDDYHIEKSQNLYRVKSFFEGTKEKARSLGIDLDDIETRKKLYEKFDKPKTYRPLGPDDAPNPKALTDQEETLRQFLQSQLDAEVDEAIQQGIPINRKKFLDAGENYSEAYVPRFAEPSKAQRRAVVKALKGNEEALELVEDSLTIGSGVRGGSRNRFLKQRMPETRAEVNRIMKEKYGIDDYFHDDIVRAYGEKILEIRQARSDKRLIERAIREFGTSDADYIKKIIDSRNRVLEARAQGLIPDPDDVFMSKQRPQDMVRLSDLPEAVQNRIRQMSDLGGLVADSKDIRLPGVVADHIVESLYVPQPGLIKSQLLGFQNAMKKFMFFTPGFHIRNMGENFMKAATMDVTPVHHTKAALAVLAGKGPYAKYLPQMLEQTRGLGLTSAMEHGAETVVGNIKNLTFKRVPLVKRMFTQSPVETFRGIVADMKARGTYEKLIREFADRGADKLLDAPVAKQAFRASTMLGERGEMLSKLAYFGKLMDQGYDAKTAMIKVNRVFLNYERTRGAVRSMQLAVPFANYMVKNLETTMKLMATRPQGFVTFGPNGAFEKAIHTWSGLDPRMATEYRELFGIDDMVFLPVMPNHEAIQEEKDWLKRSLFTYMKDSAEPGDQLWFKLPSNYHALKMMEPEKMTQNFGPLVHGIWILASGRDFNGKEVPGRGTSWEIQFDERFRAATEELKKPVVPATVINYVRTELNKRWPEIEEKLINFGLNEEEVKVLLRGNDLDPRYEEKMKRAVSRVKLFWNGGATQADLAFIAGLQAEANAFVRYARQIKREYGEGKRSEKQIDQTVDRYYETMDRILLSLDLLDDYNRAIAKQKDVPIVNEFIPQIDPLTEPDAEELDPSADEEPMDVNDDAELEDEYSKALMDEEVSDVLVQNGYEKPSDGRLALAGLKMAREPAMAPRPPVDGQAPQVDPYLFYDMAAPQYQTSPSDFFGRQGQILEYFQKQIEIADKLQAAGDFDKSQAIYDRLNREAEFYKNQRDAVLESIKKDYDSRLVEGPLPESKEQESEELSPYEAQQMYNPEIKDRPAGLEERKAPDMTRIPAVKNEEKK